MVEQLGNKVSDFEPSQYNKRLIDYEKKRIGILSKQIDLQIKNDLNDQKTRKAFCAELDKLTVNENSDTLMGLMKKYTASYIELEAQRDLYTKRLNDSAGALFKYYPQKINKTKTEIAKDITAKNNLNKKQQEFDKARNTGNTPKLEKLQKDLAEAQTAERGTDTTARFAAKEYELNRLKDIKLAFTHMINAEMFYHAKALEQLNNIFIDFKSFEIPKAFKEVTRKRIILFQDSEEAEQYAKNAEIKDASMRHHGHHLQPAPEHSMPADKENYPSN